MSGLGLGEEWNMTFLTLKQIGLTIVLYLIKLFIAGLHMW